MSDAEGGGGVESPEDERPQETPAPSISPPSRITVAGQVLEQVQRELAEVPDDHRKAVALNLAQQMDEKPSAAVADRLMRVMEELPLPWRGTSRDRDQEPDEPDEPEDPADELRARRAARRSASDAAVPGS